MPPLKQTRVEWMKYLAALALVSLATPLERLAAAGRRAFELPPRVRKPTNSVRRDG
ncbi:MAG: hypothetical protein AAB262_01740 [Elusimicrobiota bacterium]